MHTRTQTRTHTHMRTLAHTHTRIQCCFIFFLMSSSHVTVRASFICCQWVSVSMFSSCRRFWRASPCFTECESTFLSLFLSLTHSLSLSLSISLFFFFFFFFFFGKSTMYMLLFTSISTSVWLALDVGERLCLLLFVLVRSLMF